MSKSIWTRREFAASTLAGVASLTLSGAAAAGKKSTDPTLRAGAAETVVSPPAEGTYLIGPGKSEGVSDDLYARAFVLDDGTKKLCLITTDLLGFDFAYNDVLVAAVSKATSIPKQNIAINASHTHNAPLTIPWGSWDKKKATAWHKALPGKLAAIAKKSVNALVPARIRYSREPTQIGFNRRMPAAHGVTMAPNPNGAIIPWTDTVTVDNLDGKHIAIFYTFAAHPVIVHGASPRITADYPGFAAQMLNKHSGGNGVMMFGQGCGGNINGFPLRSGIEAAKAAGRDLAHAVGRAVRNGGTPIKGQSLAHLATEFTLPLADPPPASKCRELVASNQGDRKTRYQELLAIAESGKQKSVRVPVRGFAVGSELAFLMLPHEMFAEYQLYAEEVSPFKHTIVLAYTNGCEIYVGTAKDYKLGAKGGYEIAQHGASILYHHRLPLRPEAENVLRQGIRRSLKKLFPG